MERLISFIKKLPKVELHAHLSGCMRKSTFYELISDNELFTKGRESDFSGVVPLDDCFTTFALIHKIQMNKLLLRRIVREVLQDFSDDSVMYLELRTTPKCGQDYTKEEYLSIIVEEMRQFEQENQMFCRLLLSIDRSKGVKAAEETLHLLQQHKNGGCVVGVDISGYPNSELQIKDYQKVLHALKEMDCKISVHVGEVDTIDSLQEIDYIIDSGVDRVGHLCHYTPHQLVKLRERKIPIEICFSSNIATLKLSDPSKHHFKHLLQYGLTVIPCTDDTLLFDTTLSNEIQQLQRTFHLNEMQILQLQTDAVQCIFDSSLREQLMQKLTDYKLKCIDE